jgi:subtilisin-like proprotein convertase family protein
MHRLWGNQVEMRTLTYTLDLDRPMEEPTAVILGDGTWSHALNLDNHAHPDFAWQPLSQTGSQRAYENPNIEFERLVQAKVHPATLAPPPPAMDSNETTASDVPKDIPDNDPAGVASVIHVATAGTIADAFVKVDIRHTYRGDLRVVLEKDGKTEVLHDRTGGSADDLKQSFDLPSFRGTNAAGDWKLTVFDVAGQDVGKLNGWSVNLVVDGGAMPPPPPPPAEAGSGTFAAAGLPVNVPDNSPAGVSSDVLVERGGTITAAKVKVGVGHPYRGDLVVALEKDGETFVLHNRAGGSADDVRQTFDVPALVGKPARGKYTLKVSDNARRDTGKLEQFEVELSWR